MDFTSLISFLLKVLRAFVAASSSGNALAKAVSHSVLIPSAYSAYLVASTLSESTTVLF